MPATGLASEGTLSQTGDLQDEENLKARKAASEAKPERDVF